MYNDFGCSRQNLGISMTGTAIPYEQDPPCLPPNVCNAFLVGNDGFDISCVPPVTTTTTQVKHRQF